MRKVTTILALLTMSTALFAAIGNGEFNAKFLEANQLMEEKQWNQAVDIWKELAAEDAENANVNYKLGYCYLQTANDKLKSLEYLQKATQKSIAKKYDPYDPAEDRAPAEAFYYLGKAYHLNYEMDKAIDAYNILLAKISKKHYLTADAKHQINQCNKAKVHVANPENYVISNVGPTINKETNDYSPVLSLAEDALFFTSRRIRPDSSNSLLTAFDTGEYKEDIYVSYKNEAGEWMNPELLDINTDEHAATISVAPDGQKLYIYYDEEGNGQIYESTLVGETWEDPVLLGSDINSDAWETHATVSADGRTLYFVSNRDGGEGGRDIYRCVKLPNDEWSKSLNLGPVINTAYEEDAVFLSADGSTLYFASTGHPGMGGFDIFYSTLGTDGEWSEPSNIGYPVNTTDDDVFFFPMANQKRAYYSSRKEEGFGLKDIYVIDMPDSPLEADLAVLKGLIIAPEGEELPPDCMVIVTNTNTGEVTEYRPRSRDGAYVSVLPPCDAYHIDYMVGEELVHEEFINVPCESAYNEIEKEIYLLPVHLDGDPKSAVIDKSDEPVVEEPVVEEPVVEEPVIEEPVVEEPKEVTAEDTGFDPENPINVEVTAVEAYFERFFVYDFHEFGTGEDKFKQFIDGAVAIIESKGSVTIHVESSASEVPSSRFKDNVELTAWRNQTARNQIEDELKAQGYAKGKDYNFDAQTELVQGPEYANDAWKKAKYEPFQYIKVWAK